MRSSANPTPAANQIDSDEDSDGSARKPSGLAADLSTPPNSFVDPSAFKQAFEKHYKEMQHKFLPDQAATADAEGRPLQEALRTMRAGIPSQQQQQKQTSASTSSTNQGGCSMVVLFTSQISDFSRLGFSELFRPNDNGVSS